MNSKFVLLVLGALLLICLFQIADAGKDDKPKAKSKGAVSPANKKQKAPPPKKSTPPAKSLSKPKKSPQSPLTKLPAAGKAAKTAKVALKANTKAAQKLPKDKTHQQKKAKPSPVHAAANVPAVHAAVHPKQLAIPHPRVQPQPAMAPAMVGHDQQRQRHQVVHPHADEAHNFDDAAEHADNVFSVEEPQFAYQLPVEELERDESVAMMDSEERTPYGYYGAKFNPNQNRFAALEQLGDVSAALGGGDMEPEMEHGFHDGRQQQQREGQRYF